MEEITVYIEESERKRRQRARTHISEALQEGRLPGMHDIAAARGLVIRERENSIFSDAWLPIAIIILTVGLLAGRNVAVLSVGIGLILIVLTSSAWRRLSLIGVTYERNLDRTHAFPGETIKANLMIRNAKPLPLTWLQFKDTSPIAPLEAGELAVFASEISGRYTLQTTVAMSGFEKTNREVTFNFPKRGFYNLGPVRYLSGDIFTLFTIEREHNYLDTVVIYPRLWPLDALELPAKEMFGEIPVKRSLFTDPVKTQGIRDYQPQDRFRDVHWKATARRGNLQTKVYEPISGMSVVVFLNVATYPKHWMGFDPNLLERAISVTASICNHAAEQKWTIGVYANGTVPGSDQPIRVPPGQSPDQIVHILEALAAVTEFATGSIEGLMQRQSARLPWSSILVLVTAVVTEEMLVGLIKLREAGRPVTLISLAKDPLPTNLDNILCYHIPPTSQVFQSESTHSSPTEAALNRIPVPKLVEEPAPREMADVDPVNNSN